MNYDSVKTRLKSRSKKSFLEQQSSIIMGVPKTFPVSTDPENNHYLVLSNLNINYRLKDHLGPIVLADVFAS